MQLIAETTLGELEDEFDALYEENEDVSDRPQQSVPIEETEEILLDPLLVRIPGYGLDLRPGVMCELDDCTGEMEPDWGLTAFYESGCEDLGDYLYYEQDGLVTALHNYIRMQRGDELDMSLPCEVYLIGD